MSTMTLNRKSYTVKGELPNGAFYLEGIRGGAVIAKPSLAGLYTFHELKGGAVVHEDGRIVTARAEEIGA